MTTKKRKLAAGWAMPDGTRKYHYFPAGETRSLCGRWLFFGARVEPESRSPDDCAACRRQLDA